MFIDFTFFLKDEIVYKIIVHEKLNSQICRITVSAPAVAEKILPGQFIMIRIDEKAERIPLTVFHADPEQGTIDIIVQKIGLSTSRIYNLRKNDFILDLIGPLGKSTEIKNYGRVLCIAGGVGIAEIFPVAAGLKGAHNQIDLIAGFRDSGSIILKEHLDKVSDSLYIATDDGSCGIKGNVVDVLKQLFAEKKYDIVFAAGPVVMMKAVAAFTKENNIRTIVSLNSIMVDGTGMCGSCRITVGDKIKFVCVDGPDFNAGLVDFDELMLRQNRFKKQERFAAQSEGGCRKCQQE